MCIFNLLCNDDGIWVARILPARPEVPDGDEFVTLSNEIVLAFYVDVVFVFHLLHQPRSQRVSARGSGPIVEGSILDGRELWPAIKARDFKQLSNSTDRATGSTTPCQSHFQSACMRGLTQKCRSSCKYSFAPLHPARKGLVGMAVDQATKVESWQMPEHSSRRERYHVYARVRRRQRWLGEVVKWTEQS